MAESSTSRRLDPFRGFNFTVTFNGLPTIGFQKISGLSIGVGTTEYREGGMNNTVRKLPGLAEFENIVCERGLTDSHQAVRWMREIVDLNNEGALPADHEFRRTATIAVLSRRRQEVRKYTAVLAFPVKLALGDLDATSNDVLIESLELTHEGLSIIAGADSPAV